MDRIERDVQMLMLLTPWEVDVFIEKCKGKTLSELAADRNQKPRVVEFLAGNLYDKIGLSHLTDRERYKMLIHLAAVLDNAVSNGRINIADSKELQRDPAPEIPSQRALAAVRNDERADLWPRVTLDFERSENCRWSSPGPQRPHSGYGRPAQGHQQAEYRRQHGSGTTNQPNARGAAGHSFDQTTHSNFGRIATIGLFGITAVGFLFLLGSLFSSDDSDSVENLLPSNSELPFHCDVEEFIPSHPTERGGESFFIGARVEASKILRLDDDSVRPGEAMPYIDATCIEYDTVDNAFHGLGETIVFNSMLRDEYDMNYFSSELADDAWTLRTMNVTPDHREQNASLVAFRKGRITCSYKTDHRSVYFIDELWRLATKITGS